jgi:hypothetical protein
MVKTTKVSSGLNKKQNEGKILQQKKLAVCTVLQVKKACRQLGQGFPA